VNPSRISRTKAPVGRRYSNPSKIRHPGLRGDFSEDQVAIQTEIRPKRCSEKCYIPDLNAVVFQDMHVRALGNFFDLGNELRNFLPVELVVSQNVDYRPIWNGLKNPFDSVVARVDVAREHDHVSVHLVRLEGRELQVEIAQDVDTHDRVNLDLISVSRLKPLGTPGSSVLPRILRSRKRPHETQINMAGLRVRGALRSDGRSIQPWRQGLVRLWRVGTNRDSLNPHGESVHWFATLTEWRCPCGLWSRK